MKNASSDRWVAYLVAITAAAIVLLFGLNRYGIWQPSEIHVADMARELIARSPVTYDRPPGQPAIVALGFRMGGVTELWGRLPTALLSFLAALALMGAARAVGDRRLAAYTGIAYVTLPLVFLNARTMHGGGVTQSSVTLALAGMVSLIWARDPRVQIAGAVVGALGGALGVYSAGVMVGLVPVLGAVGLAVLLRIRHETPLASIVGAGSLLASVVLGVLCVRATAHDLTGVSLLLGATNHSPAPTAWQTFEGYFEHIAHATFPWTGFVPFGLVRLVSPPSPLPEGAKDPWIDEAEVAEDDASGAWRESGMRITAFVLVALTLGLQTYHMQLYGMSPFVAAAPLALGLAVLLRDCEREQSPWRTVAVAAALGTVLMLRDFLQFPKTGYAALGLPEGGPTFPTGFAIKFSEWIDNVRAARSAGGDIPPMPGEGFAIVETVMFMVGGILVVFQGAGEVKPFGWSRPLEWLNETESEGAKACRRERKELGRRTGGSLLLSNLRVVLAVLAVVCVVVGLSVPGAIPQLTTPGRNALRALVALPFAAVLGTFATIAVWNFYAWLGRPGGAVNGVLGSRVAWVPLAATAVALVISQGYFVALSEHMSPRGVWSVVRALRHGTEPVGRFGGSGDDPATRYYTSATVETLGNEGEAVGFLTRGPRSFLVIGSDVFPSLNAAYRVARRQNLPIADATNSNLLLAVSDLEGRRNRNPLGEWVRSERPTMRHAAREAVRWEDSIEYIGYDLDSRGAQFVPLGGTFKVTFVFRVLRDPGRNWQLFVHTDGPGPRMNGDHEAVGGRYPTRYWRAGDFIRDQITVSIPSTYRAGTYTVYMGFFDGGDRMRLDGGNHDRDNRAIVVGVNVR